MHRVVTTPHSPKSPLSSPWQDLGPGSAESYFKHCIFSTYPNSRSEEFILCASWSRSPSALVFFTLSLPARSQLRETKLTLTREASVTLSLFNNNWPWKGIIHLSRLRTLFRRGTGRSYEINEWKIPGVFFIRRPDLQRRDAYCIPTGFKNKPPPLQPLEAGKQNII